MTIGPQKTSTDELMRRVARKRGLARAVLSFERLWPALWPAVGVAGLFLCAALLDVLPSLTAVPHAVLLAVGALAFVGLLARALWTLRLPGAADADRRLEAASGLRHRPLAVLADRPALPGAETVWRAHVARAAAQLARLRVGFPHPGLAARDRMALRCGLAVAVLACLGIAGADAPLRLWRAVSPGFAPGPPAPASLVQAWITPPGYTGQAPVFLKEDTGKVSVPTGSHLTVSVTGSSGEPSFTLAGRALPFQTLDAASFQSDQDLAAGGRLEVRRHGRTLGGWDVAVIDDEAPAVRFPEPPGRARNAGRIPQTRLPWEVHHAYGVASLQAELRLRDRPAAPPLVVAIPLPNGNPKSAKGARLQDLTAHPWAGLPVAATLVAKDTPGLTGRSEAAEFVLPERRFENPIARALVAVRKDLSRTPDERAPAVLALTGLGGLTDAWGHDWGAFLNLRAITAAVRYARDGHDIESAQARIWLLALHLEEGLTDRTAKSLEAARQALRELMDRQKQGEKIDPAEIDKKMSDVQEALQRHLEALAEQARRDPATEQFDPDAHQLDARDMQKLAEQAREAAKQGNMEDAQQKLAELDKMLEELQNARPEHGKMTERERQRAQQRQRGQQQMNALQDIVRREGGLLDHSQARDTASRGNLPDGRRPYGLPPRSDFKPFGSQDQGQPPQGAGSQTPEQQKQAQERTGEQAVQQALRRAVGELMQQYGDLTGEVPPNLGDADTAMRDAQQSLAQGRDGAAASAQQKAIEALQKGGQSMSMQMAQKFGRSRGQQGESGEGEDQEGDGDQMGAGQGQGQGNDGQRYGQDNGQGRRPWDQRGGRGERRADDRRDPLGRPLKEGTSGSDESGDVAVPEKMEEARSRAIQDELRRRDAERGRPQFELDYIERLLKRF